MRRPRSRPRRAVPGSRRALAGIPLFFVLLFLLQHHPSLCREAAAQAPPQRGVWLQVGVGAAGAQTSGGGPAFLGHLSLQRDLHRVTLRALDIVQASLFGSRDEGEIVEVSGLYGRGTRGEYGHAAVSVGAAWVRVPRCGGSVLATCHTVGLPVVGEAALRFFPAVGLGLQGFLNLNPRRVFGGAAVTLQLGWLP